MSSQKNKSAISSIPKAFWDMKTTEQFIQACIEQIDKGERNGTTLTKKGWANIIAKFNEMSGKNYDRPQLKNKWDSLKKEWQAWHKLFGKETGLGWDSEKNTVDAPDEWWEKKQLENPQYAKFRNKGLPFAHQLTRMFKDVVATGQYAWPPTSGVLPTDLVDDDVYRPALDSVPLDIEEGSGDSEEDLHVVGTTETAEMDITPSSGASAQKSGEKRKRATEKKGNAKKLPAARIAEAVSIMAETCRSRCEAVKEMVAPVPGSSIGEVIAELMRIDAITSDHDFYSRCCNLMLDKQMREMVVAMKGREDLLVSWLRHTAYNTPSCPKE